MPKSAKLIIEDKTYEFPILEGSEKEEAIDISTLRAKTGLVTLDYGYKNTGATTSGITFLDGEKGILRYRGYPIEQLAEKAEFLEIAYLLIFGNLPNQEQYKNFKIKIDENSFVHEDMRKFLSSYPQKAHPMGILSAALSTLSTFYPESHNPNRSEEKVELTIHRVIAKLPTLAAWAYSNSMSYPYVYPRQEIDYCENFLRMMFDKPNEEYQTNPIVTGALNKLLILHADHEQNCSTSTVRIVGSSQANLYSSISAGISALWGPLHGGANQAVIEMLENIKDDGGNIDKWVEKAKDKNDSFRLMGFGHRVYKNFDPRALIIKKAADDVLDKLNIQDETLDIAKKLEEIALKDEYFISKNLYPNVDFYSGIIYRALNIPTKMFTVMFSLGRLPGWIAQWKEMVCNKEPIGRPRQIYTGENQRDYISLEKRK